MIKRLSAEEKLQRALKRQRKALIKKYITVDSLTNGGWGGYVQATLKQDWKGKSNFLRKGSRIGFSLNTVPPNREKLYQINRVWYPDTKYYSHHASFNNASYCMANWRNRVCTEIGGDTPEELAFNLVEAFVEFY